MTEVPGVAQEPPMTRVNVPALRLALMAVISFNKLKQSEVSRATGINQGSLSEFLKNGVPLSGSATLILMTWMGLSNSLALGPPEPEPVPGRVPASVQAA